MAWRHGNNYAWTDATFRVLGGGMALARAELTGPRCQDYVLSYRKLHLHCGRYTLS